MRSVEEIQDDLRRLGLRRERLRDLGAGPGVLERNRLAIVRAQQELSYALIARYSPSAEAA